MGLYSTNRAATVAAESANVDAQVEEVNLEGVEPDYGSVLETVLQIHESDRKMFDTLIEADFLEATNNFTLDEATALALNEENDQTKAGGIGEKIKKLVGFIVEKIKQACAALVNKVTQLFKGDEALYKKYADKIGGADFSNFAGIKNFRCPKAQPEGGFHSALSLDQVISSGSEGIAKKKEELTGEAFLDKYLKPAKETWKPEGNEAKDIVDIMKDAKGLISNIKKFAAEDIANVKKAAGYENKKVKEADGEAAAKKDQYSVISDAVKLIMLDWNSHRAAMVKWLGNARKAFVILGRFASGAKAEGEETKEVEKIEGEVVSDEEKKAQDAERAGKAQQEAALVYAIGEASDAYIESVFGY